MKPRSSEAQRLEADYLDRIRSVLAGHDPAEREDILSSVAETIEEVAEQHDGAQVSLTQMASIIEILGAPETYGEDTDSDADGDGAARQTAARKQAQPQPKPQSRPAAHEVHTEPGRPIGKWHAILWVFIGTIAAVIIEIAPFLRMHDEEEMAVILVGFAFVIPGVVFSSILHYRCWKRVPLDRAKTSPGFAVGLLFVPIFNMYWAFVSYPGLATGLSGQRGSGPGYGLGITLGVLTVLSTIGAVVPGAGVLLSPAWFVVWFFFVHVMVGMANRLPVVDRP